MPHNLYWTTKDEFEFIKNIGTKKHTGRANMRVFTTSRLDLLQGYARGARRRSSWAGMNKNKIMAFVEKEIKNEEFLIFFFTEKRN